MNLGHLNLPSAIGFGAVYPPMCFLPDAYCFTFRDNSQVWNTLPHPPETTQVPS